MVVDISIHVEEDVACKGKGAGVTKQSQGQLGQVELSVLQ